MRDDFAVFILSHKRPENVITYSTLKRQGYTGKIYIVIDNEDITQDKYTEVFGDNVIVFDKQKMIPKTDTYDLSGNNQAVVFARNVCFEIAEKLGLRYFLQLDDDYKRFVFRYEEDNKLKTQDIKNLDLLFTYMIEFLNDTDALTVALSQSGDFIGGLHSDNWRKRIRRKAMNTFFCDVKKPFVFSGRMNEDVNMYVTYGNKGKLILTVADATIKQRDTQKAKGGMTDIYMQHGTYLKSFYSVICSPQCVKVADMNTNNRRIHHRINWNNCTPMILNARCKK